jgi:hypothetical protein
MDPESKDMLSKEVGEKEEKVIFNSEDTTGKAVRKRRRPFYISE